MKLWLVENVNLFVKQESRFACLRISRDFLCDLLNSYFGCFQLCDGRYYIITKFYSIRANRNLQPRKKSNIRFVSILHGDKVRIASS